MALTDEEFREEYKPLQIPAHYDAADTYQHKVIFALAQLGEATAEQVITELKNLEPGMMDDHFVALTKTILTNLFDKGLLNGNEQQGTMHYNLSKIIQANKGAVDPGLLAPGLD